MRVFILLLLAPFAQAGVMVVGNNVGVVVADVAGQAIAPSTVTATSEIIGSGTFVSTFTSTGQLQLSADSGTVVGIILGGVFVSTVNAGCGTSALPTGNGNVGKITTSGTATSACGISWSPAYLTGSVCTFLDISRNLTINTVAEGVASATVTFSGAWTSGDVIHYTCFGY